MALACCTVTAEWLDTNGTARDFKATIHYCPMHAAAGDMLAALEEAEAYLEDGATATALHIISAAIKKAAARGGA